ncbi:hypothetical protein [Polyangium sp. y55x31]|uniref:hypothetical protein n=1 Tax=Polyangium sp. y55x31 TaxID=3042688 RepID=UPI002482EE24|nr:hypothetical protein [Polyangium sp. y55x31]MDI1475918.1 hypothetical protein [Polyangium sp. y55x31]
MSKFTKDLGGSYQAHHILEEAMARKLELVKNFDKLPAVILTEAQHKNITRFLNRKRPNLKAEELWKLYEEVYKPFPHWLEAIKPYFGK